MKKEISEEFVYKTYDDNALIHFEVTVAKDNDKWFTMISGLPDFGEIKDIDTLKRIIRCLESAKNRWKQQLLKERK
jgi:hypothetical protein